MAVTNPYVIAFYTSALTAALTIVCTIIFAQKKNLWRPMLKGAGLAFCIMFVLGFAWMVFI
jgi:hypothetical protein